jgi:DNA-binding transcriptional ArsR family regulator
MAPAESAIAIGERPYLAYFDQLDGLILSRTRLRVVSVLARRKVSPMKYVDLHEATGISMGNLFAHLVKPEDAGVIELQKRFVDKKPQTAVVLTRSGIERMLVQLQGIRDLRDVVEGTLQGSQS